MQSFGSALGSVPSQDHHPVRFLYFTKLFVDIVSAHK